MTEDQIPSFRRGVRFRFDETRQQWVLLAPERLFMLDDIATEMLKLVDGSRTIADIVSDLAARFDAPREIVAEDVIAALVDLQQKGAISV